METGIATTLKKHAADAKGDPKVRGAITKHLRETEQHAKAIERALKSMEAGHPVIREGISQLVNLVAGVATSLAADTSVKNAIADFATEHFEIACYTALAEAADAAGERDIARTCRSILKEEQAMAKTLAGLLPTITEKHLSQLEDDPENASRMPAPRAAGKQPAKKTPAKSAPKRKAAKR